MENIRKAKRGVMLESNTDLEKEIGTSIEQKKTKADMFIVSALVTDLTR